MNARALAPWIIAAFTAACGSSEPQDASDVVAENTAPQQPATNPEPMDPAPPAPAPKLSLTDATKNYVAEASAAWGAKDAKRFSKLYTEGAVIGLPGPTGLTESKLPDMEKSLAGYFEAFPDLQFTYTRVVGSGNLAVAEWVFTGTNKGALMGQKATNKAVGYRGASLLTFAPDGKVQRETVYFDMGTMMGQLGMGPKGQPVRPAEAAPKTPTEFVLASEGAPEAASDAIARTWFSTAEKADAKAISALATEDIVVANQYMPADSKGKKTLEKELTEGAKAFVDQKTSITVCVPTAQIIACEYTWQATWKGPAMGMKPTGKTGTIHSLEILEVKDAKIARTTAYANGAEFAATFGLLDAAKPPSGPVASGTK